MFSQPFIEGRVVYIKRKINEKDILAKIGEIAFGKSNDAVKLAFLNADENPAMVDRLDLTMLSEVKRGSNGTVEIKLLNRLDALELLSKLTDCGGKSSGAEEFFGALDMAASGGGTPRRPSPAGGESCGEA